MMVDFRKLAADAKAAHDQTQASQAEARARSHQQSVDAVAKATGALDTFVAPILERAISELRAEGIHAELLRVYDVVGNYRYSRGASQEATQSWPHIKFQCKTPPRARDGYQADANPSFFESDGDLLTVGTSDSGSDRFPKTTLGTAPVQQCEGLVSRAVTLALESYFVVLKDFPAR